MLGEGLSLDNVIARLSKNKQPHVDGNQQKTEHILLVSQTNNACLSLSSSDEELDDGMEPDLHQCGHCKLMFDNLRKYFVHKLQKVCWNNKTPPVEEWNRSSSSTSPGVSEGKDEIEDERDLADQMRNETKASNHSHQKRKNRKGLVRRIPPLEMKDDPRANPETPVFFDDELANSLSPKEVKSETSNNNVFYSQGYLQFDRIPSKLPPIMTTRMSSSDLTKRNFSLAPPSFAVSTTTSTWISHYTDAQLYSTKSFLGVPVKTEKIYKPKNDEVFAENGTPHLDSVSSYSKIATPQSVDNPEDAAAGKSEKQEDKSFNNDNQDVFVGSPTFNERLSPVKLEHSPTDDSLHSGEDFNHKSNAAVKDSVVLLPRHRQLSESTIDRLITEPSSHSGDPSWKHAKQIYRCPLCAKMFPFKSKLQRHVLVHTGIKPYKCTVCGRGFTQQIDLQRHLTRHTGEKPFKCHLCKAQFIRADNLRKHCKDAHYVNIDEPIRKRRRKTTASDTVLPPLEVAIALALSETERNGGRVLGRTNTRNAGKTVQVKPRELSTSTDHVETAPKQSNFARSEIRHPYYQPVPTRHPSDAYPPAYPQGGYYHHRPYLRDYDSIVAHSEVTRKSAELEEFLQRKRSYSDYRLTAMPRFFTPPETLRRTPIVDEHRALFREKPSINFGDYRDERPYPNTTNESLSAPDFVSEKDCNNEDEHVYVDEQEIPIVRPSDATAA